MRIAKWILLGLVTLVAGVAGFVWIQSGARIARTWEVPAAAITLTTDAATLEHGRHLAVTRGCTECHAADLGGAVMADDGFMGRIVSTNLTTGKGGIAAQVSDAQLARALRHGVRHDGRSMTLMPAVDYFPMSDDDVVALLSYVRTVPPVDRELPPTQLGPGARALIVLAGAPLLSAETVDHTAARAAKPAAAITPEYGKYVAAVCVGCHAADFAGGIVNGPPGSPPSANITPAGEVGGWTEEQFLAALRAGRRPDGRELNRQAMPWPAFAHLDDTEARAIWAYLRTLPPVAR